MRYLFCFILSLFCSVYATHNSREADPDSLVQNVSTIYGDYSEVEIDLVVAAPDPLVLSRCYSSQDLLSATHLGGWRFYPHCFLKVQSEDRVETGNPDGALLTYVKDTPTTFKIDAKGIANTAKGVISEWTNLKNNELTYDPQIDRFTLFLGSVGKRFYAKQSADLYRITHEVLPSGNKVFYEFDAQGRLTLIKETNDSEKKVLAWIKLSYDNTWLPWMNVSREKSIHITASDGQTVDYQFQTDQLLTHVVRSNKPTVTYKYDISDRRPLLVEKNLPEGRFVRIDYHKGRAHRHKVRGVTAPSGITLFTYKKNHTEMLGPDGRQTAYRYDQNFQLTAVEHFLDGSLYRVIKKSWEKGNLRSISLADAKGSIFHHKHFAYDPRGNIIEEREYGNYAEGVYVIPLLVGADGRVTNQQGSLKTYASRSEGDLYGFLQGDATGAGVTHWYKKGTNLLIKKTITDAQATLLKQHTYTYNEDAALKRVTIEGGDAKLITCITPKRELPNVGAPEIIEQRYSAAEHLLTRTVHQFDAQGNSISQAIYDTNGRYCYTTTQSYANGLLLSETDPLGHQTRYSYDANHNLLSKADVTYGYDLSNRLIRTTYQNRFETQVSYDAAGNPLTEIDRFGNETQYTYDSLNRLTRKTYPRVHQGPDSSLEPTYIYQYDLFDHPISVEGPNKEETYATYNVHHQPIEINHYDVTEEQFKYDSGGNLRIYYGKNGVRQECEYDCLGRVTSIQFFEKGEKAPFKTVTSRYNSSHKLSETDAQGHTTEYAYDEAGRLTAAEKGNRKVEFIYDSLGRVHAIKKWKSPTTFTLEVKEYDLLGRAIEERIEETHNQILFKKRYVYNTAGQLVRLIGYPNNRESTLITYAYDGFGRLCKATDSFGQVTTWTYDDAYINTWGQKAEKRICNDPLGRQTEEIFDASGQLIKTTKRDASGELLADTECFREMQCSKTVTTRTAVIVNGIPIDSYDAISSFMREFGTMTLKHGASKWELFDTDLVHEIPQWTYIGRDRKAIDYGYDRRENLDEVSYKQANYKLAYDLNENVTAIDFRLCGVRTRQERTLDAHGLPLSETIIDPPWILSN